MVKVLHVVPLARRAGLQVMFINYLKELKKINPAALNSHIVFAINFKEDLIDEIEHLGVKCYKSNRAFKLDFRVLLQMKRIIRENGISIIYGQNSTGSFWGWLAHLLTAKETKLLCHEHGTAWSSNKPLIRLVTKLWLKKADCTIANSYATKTLLERKFCANAKNIQVVYNGVPESKRNKDVIKRKMQLLFVGRLDDVKSPMTIIEAVHILWKRKLKVAVIFLGDGPLLEVLKSRVHELGLHDMVQFKGSVGSDEVVDYMAASSYLILPSIRESLGNVIIEAAMQNTATIATKVDGIPEVIRGKEYGRLITPTICISKKEFPGYSVDPETFTLTQPKKISPIDLANVISEELLGNHFVEKGIRAGRTIPKRHKMSSYVMSINAIYDALMNGSFS
ncbi:glycosyltransferase [Globicatella sulfidifaciens]|uniref:Glycosyltransferase n=1 Tax=Globicatella sulfidifaciens TaxID=136093 RepID=A0A7X8C5R2_9LACT|nr:glycosyltransferase [Globicatella sulfidifaciens]NLJ19431.1 glycosyltransferase [Globicatella sulfidifaciens]